MGLEAKEGSMNRQASMELVQAARVNAARLAPLATAWECPCCYLVVWETEGMPRCRRCGFWETAS